MNIYVMKMNEVTTDDLVAAKNISKNNRLLLLTDEVGTMTCFLYPLLTSLKVTPEFIPLNEDIDAVSLAFILGTQCNNINGTLYLISNDNNLHSLNDIRFSTEKGIITVQIAASFNDVLPTKTKRSQGTAKKENISENIITSAPFSNIENETHPQENPEQADTVSEEPIIYEDAPEDFCSLLRSLPSGIEMEPYANILAESIRNTTDGFMSSLEFQIKMRLSPEMAELFSPILEEHIEELKSTL